MLGGYILNDNEMIDDLFLRVKGKNYKTEEDYELNGGFEKFRINEIEVYSVEMN